MTNEELNNELYEKMLEEQEEYRGWLISLPPEEILNHCYEYTIREDILSVIEFDGLTDERCRALLKSPCPLDDLYKSFTKIESDHMDEIRDTVDYRADDIIDRERWEAR